MPPDPVVEKLLARGSELAARPRSLVRFTGDDEADEFLNDLENYPHAFVIGCLMDRQVKAARAWKIPFSMKEHFGTFAIGELADLGEADVAAFMKSPRGHRLHPDMTKNFRAAIARIVNQYGGDASRIWADSPSSATLVRRFLEFDGFGQKISTMATNILVRDFHIPVSDKISIDVSIDTHVARVFKRLGLVPMDASPDYIIFRAREINPLYPGLLDYPAYEIGSTWCHARMSPSCSSCYMADNCPTNAASKTSGG